jgi:aminoglycoside phosphotransferase (APT) family kinase protein
VAGNVWDAEQALDADAARTLLAAQFPELALDSVVELAYGFDNTVFVVDGTWAVRFPRRQVAVDLFEKEIRLLPAIAGVLPVAVPVPELVGRPQDDYPWPFWGGRLLPGAEIADARLPEDGRDRLGADIGAFLRRLHDTRLADLHGAELPHDPMRRATPASRGPIGRAALDRLAELGHWRPGSASDMAFDSQLARGQDLGPPKGPEVLVHGDLHLRHVLVEPDGTPTGVIDWCDACLADPVVDLAFGYGALAGSARDAFFAAYGRAPTPERELRARVLAACLGAVLAEYAVTESRPLLLTESLASIGRALDDDPDAA